MYRIFWLLSYYCTLERERTIPQWRTPNSKNFYYDHTIVYYQTCFNYTNIYIQKLFRSRWQCFFSVRQPVVSVYWCTVLLLMYDTSNNCLIMWELNLQCMVLYITGTNSNREPNSNETCSLASKNLIQNIITLYHIYSRIKTIICYYIIQSEDWRRCWMYRTM